MRSAVPLVLVVGIAAPQFSAGSFGNQHPAMRSSGRCGRKVEIGEVHFSLHRPGFLAGEGGDPRRPGYRAGAGGLRDLARSRPATVVAAARPTGVRFRPAGRCQHQPGEDELRPGRWNFEPLLNRDLIAAFPEIHIRGSRINFKFGNDKSVFYLTETDLDISPPSRKGPDWTVRFSGGPGAHGPADPRASAAWRRGGAGTARATPDGWIWMCDGEQSVGEIIALVRGQHAASTARFPRTCTSPGLWTMCASTATSSSKTCTAGTCCRPMVKGGRSGCRAG